MSERVSEGVSEKKGERERERERERQRANNLIPKSILRAIEKYFGDRDTRT